jgi:Fic family protein
MLFLDWFNSKQDIGPLLKAAFSHLWFVSIHPFEDGNGRITRAITDMQLGSADQSKKRFYSMSAQMQAERDTYYAIVESTQKGDLDITAWLERFLDCLLRFMVQTDETIAAILKHTQFWETHRTTNFNSRQQKMLQLLLDDFFRQADCF